MPNLDLNYRTVTMRQEELRNKGERERLAGCLKQRNHRRG